MHYRFVFTAQFDRDLKALRKHNPGLREDFESFTKTFDRKFIRSFRGPVVQEKQECPPKGVANGVAIV